MDIQIEHLDKAYGENQVLKDFSAVIPEGKTTCIMAPSGKGKTTLLNILLGLESYDGGRIRGLEGKKKSAVFQEDRLCENLSSRANIRMIREKKISRGSGFLKKMEEGLEALELQEWGDQPVRKLSGGMKRRTAILRALLADWEILFMDEPFKGLDIETKKKVMEYVKNECLGKTVAFVTHDPEEAKEMGAEILVL
ncbi:MAG TPA: ATP-binding cassette domain-containing protein [Candidatus Blautia avicola]|uniref:ATP-binding cassette domain-containing protein n=1 Tax=Candidatus Blautia avicola TaxID=2838483 RepID=A0A9D2TWD9_9FIRM|nr:ATP-binding cassette domain-containing protein [Candidatus Blautia avicola]